MFEKKPGDFNGKRVFKSDGLDDDLFECNSVVSSTECTGLAPMEIMDEYESDSYTEIYDVPLENN